MDDDRDDEDAAADRPTMQTAQSVYSFSVRGGFVGEIGVVYLFGKWMRMKSTV